MRKFVFNPDSYDRNDYENQLESHIRTLETYIEEMKEMVEHVQKINDYFFKVLKDNNVEMVSYQDYRKSLE